MSDDTAAKGEAEVRRGLEAVDQQRAVDVRREAERLAAELRAWAEGRSRAREAARRRMWYLAAAVTVLGVVIVVLIIRS
jgi:type IV secretory pathway component VirB8